MPKIKVNKNKNYTVMSNYHLRDKNLSYKAKGLLSFMLSLPDNWDYSINGLVAVSKENETAIKNILNELKINHYLEIVKVHNDKGRYEYEYNIYEQPQHNLPKVENPPMDNPPMEEPVMDNQGQINNKEIITNKQLLNEQILNNKKINKRECEIEFEEIWNLYPKKQGKANSLKNYIKARQKGIAKETIVNGLMNYIHYIQMEKIDNKYIKNGSTWFYQECWNDDYETKRKITTKDLDIDISDFLED